MRTCRGKHDSKVVYDGTENYKTAIRWCAACGAIYHPVRLLNGDLTKRSRWQAPHLNKIKRPSL